jgi:hypothetical protein
VSGDREWGGPLAAFLAARGATREDLLTAVGEPFGRPLLVMATGSILAGFGNGRSDIDINVVVEHHAPRLPIPSHELPVLVDATYFGRSVVEAWVSAIRDQPWPPAGPLDRAQWLQHRANIFNCTRFACGLTLVEEDDWDFRIAEFREPWLRERVAEWWRIESVRRGRAARWLADARPLLASQLKLEAVLAALEGRAAAAGQIYFKQKWLAEKLRAIEDEEGMAVWREVMRAPTSEREVGDYLARCDDLLLELGCRQTDGLTAQLWYLPGVKLRALDERTLVSRWDLRGIEFGGAIAAVPEPPQPIWEGALDERPSADVLSLFVEDMTWLAIVA